MTRKDYERIAKALAPARAKIDAAGCQGSGEFEGVDVVECELVELLRAENPNFHAGRFAKAANVVATRDDQPVERHPADGWPR